MTVLYLKVVTSVDNVILLRLCTVREGLGLSRGLGIKNDLSCV